MTMNDGSERLELREAETLFRRALEIKPDHAEARMRDGRVTYATLPGKSAHASRQSARSSWVTRCPSPKQDWRRTPSKNNARRIQTRTGPSVRQS